MNKTERQIGSNRESRTEQPSIKDVMPTTFDAIRARLIGKNFGTETTNSTREQLKIWAKSAGIYIPVELPPQAAITIESFYEPLIIDPPHFTQEQIATIKESAAAVVNQFPATKSGEPDYLAIEEQANSGRLFNFNFLPESLREPAVKFGSILLILLMLGTGFVANTESALAASNEAGKPAADGGENENGSNTEAGGISEVTVTGDGATTIFAEPDGDFVNMTQKGKTLFTNGETRKTKTGSGSEMVWLAVVDDAGNVTGWIPAHRTNFGQPETVALPTVTATAEQKPVLIPTVTPEPDAVAASEVVVRTYTPDTDLNIRSGPGITYTQVIENGVNKILKAGTSVELIQRNTIRTGEVWGLIGDDEWVAIVSGGKRFGTEEEKIVGQGAGGEVAADPTLADILADAQAAGIDADKAEQNSEGTFTFTKAGVVVGEVRISPTGEATLWQVNTDGSSLQLAYANQTTGEWVVIAAPVAPIQNTETTSNTVEAGGAEAAWAEHLPAGFNEKYPNATYDERIGLFAVDPENRPGIYFVAKMGLTPEQDLEMGEVVIDPKQSVLEIQPNGSQNSHTMSFGLSTEDPITGGEGHEVFAPALQASQEFQDELQNQFHRTFDNIVFVMSPHVVTDVPERPNLSTDGKAMAKNPETQTTTDYFVDIILNGDMTPRAKGLFYTVDTPGSNVRVVILYTTMKPQLDNYVMKSWDINPQTNKEFGPGRADFLRLNYGTELFNLAIASAVKYEPNEDPGYADPLYEILEKVRQQINAKNIDDSAIHISKIRSREELRGYYLALP